MNRQYRRMLAKPGKGDQFAQEMYRIGIRDASTKATTNTIILACEVLREKYGFGKKAHPERMGGDRKGCRVYQR